MLPSSLGTSRKNYGGLRPLRIAHFALRENETAALVGFDRAAAEVLVNLITAATLPDSGDVEVFGSPTRLVTDSDAWFRSFDQFGIVSERVPLLDELSVEQNLALPLSFEVDDLPADVRSQVRQIADEMGISATELERSMATADADTRTRVRIGKALVLTPRILLAEHPNAAVPSGEVARLGRDLAAVAASRRLAMLGTNHGHRICRGRMQSSAESAAGDRRAVAGLVMDPLVHASGALSSPFSQVVDGLTPSVEPVWNRTWNCSDWSTGDDRGG